MPSILAVVVGSLGARASAGGAAEEAWRALFAQPDPAAATKQIEAVLSACGNDAGRLKSLIAADRAYEAFGRGWQRRTVTVLEGRTPHEAEFYLRVPKGYSPRRSYPLLLAAHWQNGSGEEVGQSMRLLLGDAVDRYVLVAPTLPAKERGFTAQPFQVQAYLKSLAWARVHLNVDDDRILVSGYGQGGYVAWHLAVMYPRLFAAAVPMAGPPYFQGAPYSIPSYLENLDHLPVWAIWGRSDRLAPGDFGNVDGCRLAAERLKKLGNSHFKPTELPGVGHYRCWPKASEFVRFLSAHKRQAVPAAFRHYFHLPQHTRGYYVEALKGGRRPIRFDKPITVEMPAAGAETPTRAEILAAGTRHLAKWLFKMWVERDRAKNALRVRPMGVVKVRVYVTEGLFDLSAPATIQFGRATWTGRVPVSARCMLLHYAATRDATARVYNEIDLQILGESSVRYK